MESGRRLTFYNAPARQASWIGVTYWFALWMAMSFVVFIFLDMGSSFFLDQTCAVDPYALNGSTLDGSPVCDAVQTQQSYSLLGLVIVLSLVLVLLVMLVMLAFPHRWLALNVGPDGLQSKYSRFLRPTIAWAEIESLGLYETAPDHDHKRLTRYLVVTVHSPEELDHSDITRLTWSAYPITPQVDRVALMWPIGRPLDSGGKRLDPNTMLERIQQEFSRELAENRIGVFPASLI